MKYLFPDSQDFIDLDFNFSTELRDPSRNRMRDDNYIHEVMKDRVHDGLLVSMANVVPFPNGVKSKAKYTLSSRQRLRRKGCREFFRLPSQSFKVMGDCGAFGYRDEDVPPYSVAQVVEFYDDCRFDYGISVDHVVLAYEPEWDRDRKQVPKALRDRRRLTLDLASDFFKAAKRVRRMTPYGVAQGWSPKSYADSVVELERIGFRRIALGGMVPLASEDISTVLRAVDDVRDRATRFHLLGVTRLDHIREFARYGVTSFDSTSPFFQAFMDDVDNYYHPTDLTGSAYTAVRIPQTDGNPTLKALILSGQVDQTLARKMERQCLQAMADYEKRHITAASLLSLLLEYEALCRPPRTVAAVSKRKPRSAAMEADYRLRLERTLTEAPWRSCPCAVCKDIKHHIIIFRGTERNKRRGFHNIGVTYRNLQTRKSMKR